MKDKDKTNEQLIDELSKLRQRLNKLEASETARKQARDALQKSNDEPEDYVEEHLRLGIDALNELINHGLTVKHLKF